MICYCRRVWHRRLVKQSLSQGSLKKCEMLMRIGAHLILASFKEPIKPLQGVLSTVGKFEPSEPILEITRRHLRNLPFRSRVFMEHRVLGWTRVCGFSDSHSATEWVLNHRIREVGFTSLVLLNRVREVHGAMKPG